MISKTAVIACSQLEAEMVTSQKRRRVCPEMQQCIHSPAWPYTEWAPNQVTSLTLRTLISLNQGKPRTLSSSLASIIPTISKRMAGLEDDPFLIPWLSDLGLNGHALSLLPQKVMARCLPLSSISLSWLSTPTLAYIERLGLTFDWKKSQEPGSQHEKQAKKEDRVNTSANYLSLPMNFFVPSRNSYMSIVIQVQIILERS